MRHSKLPVLWVALFGLLMGLLGCYPQGGDAGDAVLLEVPEDPTVTFKVWVRTGSVNDPPGKQGLAHLTGQMISDGATEANSYEKILELLYPLASWYRVRVDREMTVMTGRTHRDNLDKFYPLFADALLRPGFDEGDFERLKTDTLNYLKNTLRYAQDEELGKAALHASVFEGQPYAHPPEGTVSSLEGLTLDDVRSFYAEHYTGSNVTIALGGGFDDGILARFRESVGSLSQGEPVAVEVAAAPDFEGRQVVLVDKDGADASISFGFPIDVRRGDRDFYALWIANSWLGEHRNSSSHLFQVIREKRGMNYGDYSYIEAFPNGGRRSFPPTHVGRSRQNFEVWIRTLPNEQAHFALRAAMRELRNLVDNGMARDDFELTREFLRKYVLHFADTTTGRLGYAVDDRFYGIDGAGHLEQFRKMMSSITLDEVNDAIRKHLQYDDVKIAIVTGQAEMLRGALAEDAPSPMTYQSDKPAEVLEEDQEIATFALDIPSASIRIVPLDEMFQ